MTIETLQIELDKLGVPRNFYSINGNLVSDTYILNQVYTQWEYFYFDEKGHTRNYRKFESENDACRFFYQVLENEVILRGNFKDDGTSPGKSEETASRTKRISCHANLRVGI